MSGAVRRRLRSLPLGDVRFDDCFWAPRIETNRAATLPAEERQLRETARLKTLKLGWKTGDPDKPHIFWDSDIYKWIEAAAYDIERAPGSAAGQSVESVADDIVLMQQPDGYLNSYFTIVEPDKRWTNLRDRHELYCAGHFFEGAVAHFDATGSAKLLDVACRFADHIASEFGPEDGKRRGYPGHEEIELALVKLARASGEGKYLDLAKYFIDERGSRPHYYDTEAKARGENVPPNKDYAYWQAQAPVREQKTVEGHSVRAGYLFAGAADVAAETGDAGLLESITQVWENTTTRRMYVTGGVGSASHGERFTTDYDLPNLTAYAETCAAISLVFWAKRMLEIEADSKYTDVMERALYNGIMSGVSLDGTRFFYENPLESRGTHHRQDWFGCACCPPNIARLVASMGHYAYSVGDGEAFVHLYAQGSAAFEMAGTRVSLDVKTEYPWKEKVLVTVSPDEPAEFALALRLPGWCRKPVAKLNGKAVSVKKAEKGYLRIARKWKKGDKVALTFPMPIERIEARPEVGMDAGRVALQRGPVVYCIEEVDNGKSLNGICLPRASKLKATFDPDLLGGVTVITGGAKRRDDSKWKAGELYKPGPSKLEAAKIKAVPYCVWDNRDAGEMLVWVREC
ncbi:MAG: glycoside hydrolase family 127 protein [Planctomycetota bacterium]|jgi:DUF1680 family protein